MPTLNTVLAMNVSLGSEEKRIDLSQKLTGVNQVLSDSMLTLAEAQASTSPSTLWAAAAHGAAANPIAETCKVVVILVDPDSENAASLPIDVEIASTRHNSTTTDRVVRRVTRETPLLISSSISGQGVSEVGDSTDLFAALNGTAPINVPRITRVRARNPNPVASGANNVKVRCVVLG